MKPRQSEAVLLQEIDDLKARLSQVEDLLNAVQSGEVNTSNTDVTPLMQAERDLDKERDFSVQLLESMPGVVYFFDETGKFLRWNKNFELVTGYSEFEIAVMSPDDFFGPDEKAGIRETAAKIFTDGAGNIEACFLTRSGEQIPYFFVGHRLVVGDRRFLIGIGVDIRERIRAQTGGSKHSTSI